MYSFYSPVCQSVHALSAKIYYDRQCKTREKDSAGTAAAI